MSKYNYCNELDRYHEDKSKRINGKRRFQYGLECYFIIIILLKAAVASGLPLLAYADAVHDDHLMVQQANYLLHGLWLGPYTNMTLVKGITFPLYLVAVNQLGIPYTASIILFYGFACWMLMVALGDLIKNKIVKAVIFTVLFFLPVNAALSDVMRAYRNSILPALTLLVIASFLGIYLNRNKKNVISWAVGAGIVLTAFWNLREDAMWILPFAVTASAVTLITILIQRYQNKQKSRERGSANMPRRKLLGGWLSKALLAALIPYLILVGGNATIRGVNQHYYHTWTRIDLSEGHFPEMMKMIYAVEQEEEFNRVSVPKSTIDKLYAASPAFAELKTYLDSNYFDGWDASDGTLDGQIEDGWLFWCIRDCIREAGYFKTPADMEAYCGRVAGEIQQALADGRLTRRSGFSMPSALMSPWRSDRMEPLFSTFQTAYWYVAQNDGNDLEPMESTGNNSDIRAFEALTHNNAIFAQDSNVKVQVSGWAVSEEDTAEVTAGLYQDDRQILLLPKLNSADVYDYYASQGLKLDNAQNARFYGAVSVESTEGLTLCLLRDETIVAAIDINGNVPGGNNNGIAWHLDAVDVSSSAGMLSTISSLSQSRMQLLNGINAIYRAVSLAFSLIGMICYIGLSLLLVITLVRKKDSRCIFDRWLIVSALLGSEVLNLVGVSYTHISSCNAIHDLYLAGAFPLQAAFWVLSIVFMLQLIKGRWLKRKAGVSSTNRDAF